MAFLRLFLRGTWVLLHDKKNDGMCKTTIKANGDIARVMAMLTGSLIEFAQMEGMKKSELAEALNKCLDIQWEGREHE